MLQLRLDEGFGILTSGFGKTEVPKLLPQAATTALGVLRYFRHFAFPLLLQKVPRTDTKLPSQSVGIQERALYSFKPEEIAIWA